MRSGAEMLLAEPTLAEPTRAQEVSASSPQGSGDSHARHRSVQVASLSVSDICEVHSERQNGRFWGASL